MKNTGSRIPPEFRLRVSRRIRTVMKPFVKENESLTAECREAATELGLYYMTVWFWYEGYTLPTIYNLVRFADYYDVSIDYLLGRTAVKELQRRGAVLEAVA